MSGLRGMKRTFRESRMIDTTSLRHLVPLLPPSEMAARGFTTTCGHSPSKEHDRTTWKLNLPRYNGTLPRLTWNSSPSGDWLTAEVSLPKFLFGNNVNMVSDADVRNALDGISCFITETVGVPFDALSALIGRVDYCWNFPVGETNVYTIVSAASQSSIPRMVRYHIGPTTATFKQQSKHITIYGKHAEVATRVRKKAATDKELHAAVGQLRLEVSYRNSDSCKRLAKRYGLPERTAGTLLVGGIAHEELERALEALNLDRTIEPTNSRIDVLREKYGDTARFRSLVAFLTMLDRYGEHFWKQGIGGYCRSTYYEYARALKAASVWLKTDESIPPLRLVRSPAAFKATANEPRTSRVMSNTISRSPAGTDSHQGSRLSLVDERA